MAFSPNDDNINRRGRPLGATGSSQRTLSDKELKRLLKQSLASMPEAIQIYVKAMAAEDMATKMKGADGIIKVTLRLDNEQSRRMELKNPKDSEGDGDDDEDKEPKGAVFTMDMVVQ